MDTEDDSVWRSAFDRTWAWILIGGSIALPCGSMDGGSMAGMLGLIAGLAVIVGGMVFSVAWGYQETLRLEKLRRDRAVRSLQFR